MEDPTEHQDRSPDTNRINLFEQGLARMSAGDGVLDARCTSTLRAPRGEELHFQSVEHAGVLSRWQEIPHAEERPA